MVSESDLVLFDRVILIESVELGGDPKIPATGTLDRFMKHLFDPEDFFIYVNDSATTTEYFIKFRTISIKNHTMVCIFI